MRAVWSLLCFLPCTLPAAAAENWFLPYEPANATLRGDPAILGLGEGVITLADVATGESIFRGASLRLSAGIPVSAVPHCVRLLEVSAL